MRAELALCASSENPEPASARGARQTSGKVGRNSERGQLFFWKLEVTVSAENPF